MQPIFLPSNQPRDRFYEGGERIQELRGEASLGNRVPEDWIGSCTPLAGHETLGTTTLSDGTPLREAIAAHPAEWLGEDHVARWGEDPKMLVKLLDAGQRLPVHAHPHDDWAAEHVGTKHGKAEAWYVLEPGTVHVGLTRDVSPTEMLELVTDQRDTEMLALLHRREVQRGDTVYVPPGVLHAIGAGILVAEIQEPEDLSILLELRGFELDGAADGHLGLGFETALGAVELTGRSDIEVDTLITRGRRGESVLAPVSTEYFRVDSFGAADLPAVLDAGLRILIVTAGAVTLVAEDGTRTEAPRGSSVLLPYFLGAVTVEAASADADVVICRPPLAGSSR